MDKLKDFISNNREAFEDDILPEGHLGRFEQKLRKTRRERVALYRLCGFVVAASVALFFFFQVPESMRMWYTPSDSTAQVCEVELEIEELQLYYNMRMSDLLSQMEVLSEGKQVPGVVGLLKETKQVLSDSYRFETTVLPMLPCSNDGLFAMNQHYSNSLESLSFMLRQMERITDSETGLNY